MPKIKLTQKIVDGLKGTEKLECWFDESTTGFGVYTKGNVKTYFVQARVNGKQVKATIGKASIFSLDDARKEARAKLVEMSKGVNPNEEKRKDAVKSMTLEKAIENFFKSRTLKTQTKDLYNRLFKLYLNDWIKKPIGSITKEMVAKRHASIAAGDRERKVTKIVLKTAQELESEAGSDSVKLKMVKRVDVEEKQPRNAAANGVMRAFRAVYNYAKAISDGALPDNPVGRLSETRQWYKVDRRRTIIRPYDLKPWYEAVARLENQSAKDFMLLLLFCGFRREEAVKLKWSDICFEENTVTVTDTKNGKPHTLPLSKFILNLLEERKKALKENAFVFPGPGKKGYIYPPVKPMNQVIDATGIKFCFHDLRRTFITVAESLDIPYAALKRLLNHSMATDVTDGYLAISTDRLREPMEKISRRLLELMTGSEDKPENVSQ